MFKGNRYGYGAYFPTVEWGDNGKYIISFMPTEEVVKTVTDFPYISYAESEDINQVCSEIDTDISNVIATNQGSASVVFPSQNGWITPRADDIKLTTNNCEIQLGTAVEKILHVWTDISGLKIGLDSVTNYVLLSDILGTDALDILPYIPEYKEWIALPGYKNVAYGALSEEGQAEKCKNNTIYWFEESGKIVLDMSASHKDWLLGDESVMAKIILYSLIKACNGKIKTIESSQSSTGSYDVWVITDINGIEYEVSNFSSIYTYVSEDNRQRKFRVEYIPCDTSTKIRMAKQEKCDYEYVQPFNQRAEIVDATSLGREMFKTVNQMGVRYFKAINKYFSLDSVLPVGTAFVDTDGTYILTTNEFEITNHDHYDVVHTFSKDWAMISSWLKQNRQYRNTKIPTDILVRNFTLLYPINLKKIGAVF